MIKAVIGFKRKPGMTIDEFREYRRDVHVPLLLAIPEVCTIRRFVVSYPVDPMGPPEPRFDGMVEVWFDTTDDMDKLFNSKNYQSKVDADHINFVDPTTVVFLVMEELIVKS